MFTHRLPRPEFGLIAAPRSSAGIALRGQELRCGGKSGRNNREGSLPSVKVLKRPPLKPVERASDANESLNRRAFGSTRCDACRYMRRPESVENFD